jgi:hypothetical protein
VSCVELVIVSFFVLLFFKVSSDLGKSSELSLSLFMLNLIVDIGVNALLAEEIAQ